MGKNNLDKFDSKSDEGIFLGYSNTSKAYRVYNKRRLVVEESIHVDFDENNDQSCTKLCDFDESLGHSDNIPEVSPVVDPLHPILSKTLQFFHISCQKIQQKGKQSLTAIPKLTAVLINFNKMETPSSSNSSKSMPTPMLL